MTVDGDADFLGDPGPLEFPAVLSEWRKVLFIQCTSTGRNFEVFQILFFRPVVNYFGNLFFFPYMKKGLVLSAVNSLQCVLLQQPWSHSTNCTNTKQIENMNKNHLY